MNDDLFIQTLICEKKRKKLIFQINSKLIYLHLMYICILDSSQKLILNFPSSKKKSINPENACILSD